jgi:hypothetical protein
MSSLYQAADPIEAEILRQYLEVHGIAVSIFGSMAWSARGELPADAYPRLHLQDPRDEARARELLHQYERRRHAHGLWHCDCGESSPITFETCWNCGVERRA